MTNENEDTPDQRSSLDALIEEYGEAIHFIAVAAMVFAIFQIIYFQLFIDSLPFLAYLGFCAELSAGLLNLIGEEVTLLARTITSAAGPSVTVVEGCDALRIYSVLAAAIIAYEGSIRQKVLGILFGIGLMFLFNVVRISMLLWVDVHHTDVFDIFHHTILPAGLWIIAVVYFYYWGSKIERHQRQHS